MRVEIVGAGPAGLYSAILIKTLARQYSVHVYEKNASQQFGGWGIILSNSTLANMRRSDPISHDRIKSFSSHQWEHIDVIRDDDAVRVRSGQYFGILRQDFLKVLSDRCRELNIEISFDTPVANASDLQTADLVIAADGINSSVREFTPSFRPTFLTSENRYLWLGASCELRNLKMIFKRYGDGHLVAQAFPSSRGMSTFVVECTRRAWDSTDLQCISGDEVLDLLSDVFKAELENNRLISIDGARWRTFVTVHNSMWHNGRTVLVGDALHSIHFSIGSGTKLAVEDAMALRECLRDLESQEVRVILEAFEKGRKSSCENYQKISQKSYLWCEQLDSISSLDIIPFTEQLLTRAGLYDGRMLALLSPEFSKIFSEWKARQ